MRLFSKIYLLALCCSAVVQAADPLIYWNADVSGSTEVAFTRVGTDLKKSLENPTRSFSDAGFAIDLESKRVFFFDNNAAPVILYSANLDGSDIRFISSFGTIQNVRGVDIDLETKAIYFADRQADSIRMLAPPYSVLSTVDDSVSSPSGLVLDQERQLLFYASEVDGDLYVHDLQANTKTLILDTTSLSIFDLTIDTANQHIYFSDATRSAIVRVDYDGSNETVIVSNEGEPRGIAYDDAANKVVWAEEGMQVIKQSNTDGTNVETVVSTRDPNAGEASVSKPYFVSVVNPDATVPQNITTNLKLDDFEESPRELVIPDGSDTGMFVTTSQNMPFQVREVTLSIRSGAEPAFVRWENGSAFVQQKAVFSYRKNRTVMSPTGPTSFLDLSNLLSEYSICAEIDFARENENTPFDEFRMIIRGENQQIEGFSREPVIGTNGRVKLTVQPSEIPQGFDLSRVVSVDIEVTSSEGITVDNISLSSTFLKAGVQIDEANNEVIITAFDELSLSSLDIGLIFSLQENSTLDPASWDGSDFFTRVVGAGYRVWRAPMSNERSFFRVLAE